MAFQGPYGLYGEGRRMMGCGTGFAILLAATAVGIGLIIMGLLAFGTGASRVILPLGLTASVAIYVIIYRANRKGSRYAVFYCDQCGIPSDPNFRICRACGRVKSETWKLHGR